MIRILVIAVNNSKFVGFELCIIYNIIYTYVNNDGGGNVMVRVAALREMLLATIDRIRVTVDRNNRVVKSAVKLKS